MSAACPTSFQVNSRRTSRSSCCKMIIYYVNYKYIGIYLCVIDQRSKVKIPKVLLPGLTLS